MNSPGSADGLVEIDIKREFDSKEEAQLLYDAITEKMSVMDEYKYGKSRAYAYYQNNRVGVAYDGETEINVVREKDR